MSKQIQIPSKMSYREMKKIASDVSRDLNNFALFTTDLTNSVNAQVFAISETSANLSLYDLSILIQRIESLRAKLRNA